MLLDRVNEFNVESLLLCALPYHGTNEFVRLVQTLALGSTKQGGWMWLAPIQTSGAALPREVLVKRCVNDAVGCPGGDSGFRSCCLKSASWASA